MAYPSGFGSERLMRGAVDTLTTNNTTLKLDGSLTTAPGTSGETVPTDCIVTILNIIFCNVNVAGSFLLLGGGSLGTSINFLSAQQIGADETFVWNDKIVLVGGDSLTVRTATTTHIDVCYSYLFQDWDNS